MLVKIPIQWTLAYPATMGPDHGQISEIAGYVNYHANRIYNAAVFFLVMLSNVSANNHISGSLGFEWSKFWHVQMLVQLHCSMYRVGIK